MRSVNPRIAYVLDTSRLDMLVERVSPTNGRPVFQHVRPWLTLCAEPVSQAVLAVHLHPDLPDLSMMCSLLYLALAPSERHPSGRIPDELCGDVSVLFSALRQQPFFEQLDLSLKPIPWSHKGITERLFGRLVMDLQRDFPVAQREKPFNEETPPTFAAVDQWCQQWAHLSRQAAWDGQQRDFLMECERQWPMRGRDAQTLDLLLEGPWQACVTSSGIEHRGGVYWHPLLPSPGARDVTIRTIVSYLPPSQIEVFAQDHWVCTAPFVSFQQTREASNESQPGGNALDHAFGGES